MPLKSTLNIASVCAFFLWLIVPIPGAAKPATAGIKSAVAPSSENQTSVHLPDEPGTAPLRETLPDSQPHDSPDAAQRIDVSPSPDAASDLPPTLPPLSIEDCQKALTWAAKYAAASDRPSPRVHSQIASVLSQTSKYIQLFDERHSNLARYTWTPISLEKVSRKGIDEDVFDNREIIKEVSAVSLQVEGGDVLVNQLRVFDEKNRKTEFSLSPPVLLRADLPRREVFHLYFPTDLKRVVIQYQAANKRGKTPRVQLYAGTTPRPEYLRMADYYIQKAIKALEQDDGPTASKMAMAAVGRLQRFRQKR